MKDVILVVDDDPDDIEFLKSSCEHHPNLDIVTFNDALTAILFLMKVEDLLLPRLIVTDSRLGEMNGYDFLADLKKEKRFDKMRTAVVSSTFLPRDVEKYKELKVDGMFIKPETVEGFRNLCNELVKILDAA